jgi:phage shock protein A
MARNLGTDHSILEAALIGFTAQRDAIQKKIDELKTQLGRGAARKAVAAVSPKAPQKAHRISPEGLKRIRDAQKRRWAAAKAQAASA